VLAGSEFGQGVLNVLCGHVEGLSGRVHGGQARCGLRPLGRRPSCALIFASAASLNFHRPVVLEATCSVTSRERLNGIGAQRYVVQIRHFLFTFPLAARKSAQKSLLINFGLICKISASVKGGV